MYHSKMIRNLVPRTSFSVSLTVALICHLAILFLVKKKPDNFLLGPQLSRPIQIDKIEIIKPEEVEKYRRVGIKDGEKSPFFRPDEIKIPRPAPSTPQLSLGNLAPDLPLPVQPKRPKSENAAKTKPSGGAENGITIRPASDGAGNIYFNPKKEKQIRKNREQDLLKQEIYSTTPSLASSPLSSKLSNFDIRYERPEGVSEDELNSDEKAYYAFFKRSYANYLSKLYATYEKIAIERPGIVKDFSNKHVLLGRIDYDAEGNIILVKILKSSESDDIHYFFEETLKQLNLPNPPKSFIKNKKQFSTYYQIQIN